MKFNNEQIKKAMACKSVDELIALAKAEGIELAKDEAEKYFEALKNQDLKLSIINEVENK